ncbi:MAG: hypothetical protein FJY26_07120 [Betaproteobacteria bacterium]|nr:hypothetical protein [Betaproteobacteria bacterium]
MGAVCSGASLASVAWAHHGWSSFDQQRPLYLHGRATDVKWRNPHAELVLERSGLALPADLAQRAVPSQVAPVDGRGLLARATLPQRSDTRWMVELAPLTRMEQWQVPEIRNGGELAVLGFTFAGEKGEAILRAEYLFLDDKVYGLRSRPV